MADTLTITKTEGRVPVFHLSGPLNAHTESQLVDAARELRESGAHYLVIDMSGVELLTSAGLRALHSTLLIFTPRQEIDAFQRANPGDLFKSTNFKLAGASTHVFSILNLAGFVHNIPIYPDLKQALDSFAQPPDQLS